MGVASNLDRLRAPNPLPPGKAGTWKVSAAQYLMRSIARVRDSRVVVTEEHPRNAKAVQRGAG